MLKRLIYRVNYIESSLENFIDLAQKEFPDLICTKDARKYRDKMEMFEVRLLNFNDVYDPTIIYINKQVETMRSLRLLKFRYSLYDYDRYNMDLLTSIRSGHDVYPDIENYVIEVFEHEKEN